MARLIDWESELAAWDSMRPEMERRHAEMDAMNRRMWKEYERHALTCENQVACEVSAWQALYRREKDRR